ncbi:hypothetical protein [Glaciecola petra]|uniref:Uncharacterized protein n=1 Tax=Glaciecola petra TaxID=3075602 RepID=A0ABU2ZYG2_9ALTE|nr:hypothetical protein [Aestuariibacter sp. P117]MDT0596629.1 hypothetical protein [Aestuariibacter sp. P117]
MGFFTALKQKRVTRKFTKHNLNILQHLTFDKMQTILQGLISQGWELYPDYLDTSDQSNAWEAKLRKGTSILEINWNTKGAKSDGSIVGLERIIVGVGKEFDTPVFKTPTPE